MLKQYSQNITRITIPEVRKKDYKLEGIKSR
jgi:hypothetical protein